MAAPGAVRRHLAGNLQRPVHAGKLAGHARRQRALRVHPLGHARARARRGIQHFQLDHAAGQISATHFQQQAAPIAGLQRQFGALDAPTRAQVLENLRARLGIVNQRRRPENAAHYSTARARAQPQKSGVRFCHAARRFFQQQHAGPQILKCPGKDIVGNHWNSCRPSSSVPQTPGNAGNSSTG